MIRAFLPILLFLAAALPARAESFTANLDDVAAAQTAAVATASAYTASTASGTLAAAKAYTDTAVSQITVPVSSVFNRTGAITSQTGDYTAAQVGADPAGAAASAIATVTGQIATNTTDIGDLKLWVSTTAGTLYAPAALTATVQTATATLSTATANIATLQSWTGTLGTAAYTSSTAYDAAGTTSTHAALTGPAAHGLGTAATLNTGTTGAAIVVCATPAAARSVLGVGEVLADVTLDSAFFPTYTGMTSSTATGYIAFPSYTPTNGDAFYFENSPPAGLPTYTNEYVGGVGYAVSSSSNTCRISLSRGGAPVTLTSTGTAGWTARLASAQSITISGFSIGNGDTVVITKNAMEGWSSGAAGSYGGSLQINGDATSGRHRSNNSEGAAWGGSPGNVMTCVSACLTVLGSEAIGNAASWGAYGTDKTPANSAPVSTSNIGAIVYSIETGNLSITSIRFASVSGSTPTDMKRGSRFYIVRLTRGL